jgi:uncharacterized membrane protein YeaQ/YmgE (transglycosylase-associated protein family)
MKNKNLVVRILGIIGVAFLQYIAAMLVMLLASVMFPSQEKAIENNVPFFVVKLGLSYAIGIWLIGWLFIVMKWRKVPSEFGLRFVTTVIGAYIPLIIALMAYPKLESGNPFLFIAVITGIIGFLVPEWLPEAKKIDELKEDQA